MHPEAIQLETLRQKIEDLLYQSGSQADFLDRGKPNATQAKQAQEFMKKLDSESTELKKELKQILDKVRKENPQAVTEWADFHLGILQKIVNENSTDTNARTRKFVAKQTITEWEKVRAGEQDYVNINWSFLKDYKDQMRKITGNGESKT